MRNLAGWHSVALARFARLVRYNSRDNEDKVGVLNRNNRLKSQRV
jgi:hypothetical protein